MLPALKSPRAPKAPDTGGVNSPPRTSTNDPGEFDGNLWEAVQIMEEEQEMEAELTPPAPLEFAIRDFTPNRTPARTPSHTSKASSNESSHHSHHSHRSHTSLASSLMGVTRSPSVASKASSKFVDSDGERADFGSRHAHRSYCGCTIL